MKIEEDIKLDFKDVLIRPKRSTLSSRSDVDLLRQITFKNSNRVWEGIPIITSNMDTIGTFEMYKVLSAEKIITCFHKHYSIKDFEEHSSILDPNFYIISTGIGENEWEKLNILIKLLEPYFICIDVANGYMKSLLDFAKKLKKKYPDITLICGNVVTREMVEELVINGGVDIIKCGIGNGSCCTTRLQTGVGMPQLSAIMECSDAAHGVGGYIISDGGICNPGDVSKALGAGADFVMMGSIFSGHDETSGKLCTDEKTGDSFKIFYGMSSETAMNKYHGGIADYRSAEGKTVKVKYKGAIINTVRDILGGIRSACTYIGALRIKDIPKCTTFLRVNRQINDVYK